jgi:predicted dithiol-disulfide oxidoreductase (DUF899 family)
LLTGDRALRAAAELEEVIVCGTLWLMGRLVAEGLITVTALERAYDRMKQAGRRLPWNEVDRQLRHYRKR